MIMRGNWRTRYSCSTDCFILIHCISG